MIRVPIDDLDDPRIALYRELKTSNATRGSNAFVLEGEKLLDALLRSRYPVLSVLTTAAKEARIAPKVPEGVPFYVVPGNRIDELVGYNFHQGALSVGGRLPAMGLDDLATTGPGRRTLVFCPKIDNPDNLGALFRIGEVFGVDGFLLGPSMPDPFSRRVLRVSMGAALQARFTVLDDPVAGWSRWRNDHGYSFAAAVTDPGATAVGDYRRPERLGLVLGPESAGLGPDWSERCDARITVPMRGRADSLNLAVAAGILLYVLTR